MSKHNNLSNVIKQDDSVSATEIVDHGFDKSAKVNKTINMYRLMKKEEDRLFIRSPNEIKDSEVKDIDIVIHMGCHSMATPHIIQATEDIIVKLGYNPVSIGGFSNCCGNMEMKSGNIEGAQKVDQNRFNNMSFFNPKYALMECTACHAMTSKFSLKHQPVDFEVASMIQFLNDRKNLLQENIENTDSTTVAFHDHYDESGWTSPDEARYARELFKSIPGIEIVELEHSRDNALPCSFLTDESQFDFANLNEQIFQECINAEADTLITFWHACNRSLAMDEHKFPVDVKNISTFIGERLGYKYRNKYKEYLHAGINKNIDWIVKDAQSIFEANGLTESEAREVIELNFVPN